MQMSFSIDIFQLCTTIYLARHCTYNIENLEKMYPLSMINVILFRMVQTFTAILNSLTGLMTPLEAGCLQWGLALMEVEIMSGQPVALT